MEPELLFDVDEQALRRAIAEAVRPALEAMREEARTNCPKDTGALAAGIAVRMGDGGAEIAASAPYAMHVEMGTAHMPARPFLYPALRAHQGDIARRAAQAANAYMRACLRAALQEAMRETMRGGGARDSQ